MGDDSDDAPHSAGSTRWLGSLRRRVRALPWVWAAIFAGALIGVVWTLWPARALDARLAKDGLLYLLLPGLLGAAYGRDLGWRVNRRAIRNAALLSLFVLPIYLVGSSLPTVRSYYPMWPTSAALSEFLPHTLMQFVVIVATETYYRGLLCVGVREIGPKSVFLTPLVYAYHHVGKPPVELLLSGPTDVLFGAVDYRSESLLPSVVAHGAGMVLLDWLVLHEPAIPPETVVDWFSWLPIPL